MSFGWSVGDIVAALNLLHKVVVALKDTGGASSDYQDVSSFLNVLTATLQHLKALQAAPLDPDLSKNLGDLCEQVQGPLTSFCERIRTSFEHDLGAESTRLKLLTAGRKLQWALSTSKKVKDLREKIGGPIVAIGIVLSQQVVQTTLQMPAEIQARIAHMIDTAVDTRISPQTLAIHNAVTTLSTAQKNSSQLIEGTIRSAGKNTEEGIQKHTQKITLDLENKFNTLSIYNKACAEGIAKIEDQSLTTFAAVKVNTAASVTVLGSISDLSAHQSQSTDLVLRTVLRKSQETAHAIQKHSWASREQTSSLHQKLDRMNLLMGTVKDRMGDLSMVQRSTSLTASHSEIQRAISNIYRSVWLLVSALHVLIRELIYLLAPYLVAIYHTSIEPLLLCGDHFLFEDAIGRRKWLPCLQFQHWKTFYNFLIDTFQGEAGLSRVLNGQFVVLNAFNEVPIHKKAWRAGIQPKSKVTMAIMLETVRKGRCANPSCPGVVEFGTDQVTRICPICRKHLSTLKDSITENEDYGTQAGFSFEFGSNIEIPILKTATDQERRLDKVTSTPPKFSFPGKVIDKDIASYKRVIWQHSDENEFEKHHLSNGLEDMRRSVEKRPPRHLRRVQARQKPPMQARKSDRSGYGRRGVSATVEENQKPTIAQHEQETMTSLPSPPPMISRYMFSELQNRKRLMMAREEQESMARHSGSPTVAKYQDGTDIANYYPDNSDNIGPNTKQDQPGVGGNHALQDYQMQLMLLEQKNKMRLMMARQEQERRS